MRHIPANQILSTSFQVSECRCIHHACNPANLHVTGYGQPGESRIEQLATFALGVATLRANTPTSINCRHRACLRASATLTIDFSWIAETAPVARRDRHAPDIILTPELTGPSLQLRNAQLVNQRGNPLSRPIQESLIAVAISSSAWREAALASLPAFNGSPADR